MKYTKLLVFLLMILFSMGSAFSASCPDSSSKGFSKWLNSECFKSFATNNLGWIDWAVYLSLLITVFLLIRDVGLKHFDGMNKRGKAFTALIISFMGVTGFMWTLVNQGIFPHYFVLFMGELLVLLTAGLIIRYGWKKIEDSDEDSDKNLKLAINVAIVLLAILIVNSFHGMLNDTSFPNAKFLNSGGDKLPEDSLLAQITSINLDIPFVLYLIAYGLLLFLLWYSDEDKGSTSGGKKKKDETKFKDMKDKISQLQKELEDVGDKYNEVEDDLRTIDNKLNFYKRQGGNS